MAKTRWFLMGAILWALAPPSPAQPSTDPSPTPSNSTTPTPAPGGFGAPTRPYFHVGSDTGFGFGVSLPDPSALEGTDHPKVALPNTRTVNNFSLTTHYSWDLGEDQRLMLTDQIGATLGNLDLDYDYKTSSGVWSFNVAQTRAIPGSYYSGSDVDLPNGKTPWLYRTNTGAQYAFTPTNTLSCATALSYEQLSIHSNMFSGQVAPYDQYGNPLTVSPTGVDQMLMARFQGLELDVDNREYPTSGLKIRFGMDKAIPIGDSHIDLTRFEFNISRFVPVDFLPFATGKQFFIFNGQVGTQFGTIPGYEAFNLGGAGSVRGYQQDELGGGSSFAEATMEFRAPIGNVHFLGYHMPLRAVAFIDYGTALGSQGEIYGKPGLVRGKLDSGMGYGPGMQLITPVGLVRLECGWNAQHVANMFITLGDRF